MESNLKNVGTTVYIVVTTITVLGAVIGALWKVLAPPVGAWITYHLLRTSLGQKRARALAEAHFHRLAGTTPPTSGSDPPSLPTLERRHAGRTEDDDAA